MGNCCAAHKFASQTNIEPHKEQSAQEAPL